MKKQMKLLGCVFLLLITSFMTACNDNGQSESYNYISAEDLKARIEAGDVESGKMVMIDSQTEEEFRESHLEGAIATFARPLESDEDFAKLDPALAKLQETDADIIILCPGGGSGATRPFDYFAENGIDEERMLILQDGVSNYVNTFPEDYLTSYISGAELVARLDAGDMDSGELVLIDSQTEEEFQTSHIPGVVATHARPLETDEDFAKLNPALDMINDTDQDIVLVCPGGGSGATRPFDYFVTNGINPHRLRILENGQNSFDSEFPEYVVFDGNN
ncbi:3-mercaptopyruvate sulfurtransferase SseA, contains two rhodanese domains [Tindallia magadiensis]|uniref:3-mercaptopyruvate sulfurtransferase SseA, contains two rhodanese domains n=1 Tax=Tindallia magadiensis TaxID=69895 RepID=A0A1I3GVG2_9FIRM|nr:rhodanese-like domain-containing protein [Tindallia magadiensis]SFI27555.1 3-mercaptopyruvate sulfurtransferase SseA, contains two rhodanese domains [Tindallia magadiensis]